MSSNRVDLPAHDRAVKEFRRLERRRGRGGIDAIQDGGRHDDLANAIVGAIHLASEQKVFNPHAMPEGVGNRGIGHELRAMGGGLQRPSPFGSTFGPTPEGSSSDSALFGMPGSHG